MTSRCIAVFAGVLSLLTAAAASPQTEVPPEVSESSEIVIDMTGAVTAKLRIVTRDGDTTVLLEKDGEVEEVVMSEDDCTGLWDYCLRRDAMELTSSRAATLYADSAVFDVSFRIGDETHHFFVEGVDQLDDTRYRELIREVLSVCARYLDGLEGT